MGALMFAITPAEATIPCSSGACDPADYTKIGEEFSS